MNAQSAMAQVTLFVTGFTDSLKVYRTFPLMATNTVLATTTFKIIGANTVLLLGSIVLFHKAITPGLAYLQGSMASSVDLLGEGQQQQAQSGVIVALFYALFVVPIYVLCYSSSMVWYQALADEMYQSRKRADQADPSVPRLKGLVDGTYATVAWFCLFGQLQLLSIVVPMLLSHLHAFLSVVVVDAPAASSAASLPSAVLRALEVGLPALKATLLTTVTNAAALSHALGWFLMSIMYGWYAFDNHWSTSGVDPDARFKIMEAHWAYFTGFGFPYTLLVKGTSFFVGYGGYLALFPFCIMLGGVSDYEEPYKALQAAEAPSPAPASKAKGKSKSEKGKAAASKPAATSHVLAPLPVFKLAQIWTLAVLGLLRKRKTKQKSA